MNLSEKIQLCRRRAGLSQEALAEKLNVSRQAVSKWETGAAEPELSKLRALAAAFGVTADWLLSEEDAEDRSADGAKDGGREGGAANNGSVRSDSASTTASGPSTASGNSSARVNSASTAGRSGFACGGSGLNGESNAAPGENSAANGDGFCTSGMESDDFTDGASAGKGSSGEGRANTASGASAHREESSASDASADGQAASGGRADFHSATPSPNWVESVPGVLGRLLRQYGWIVGLRMAISVALMTFIGFLGRAAVRSMDQGFGVDFPELLSSQTAWYDDAGNLMTSPIAAPSQPSDPMTILCTGMIVLGVILILAGICIAVSLRNQHKE